jgi:hypothetical protein
MNICKAVSASSGRKSVTWPVARSDVLGTWPRWAQNARRGMGHRCGTGAPRTKGYGHRCRTGGRRRMYIYPWRLEMGSPVVSQCFRHLVSLPPDLDQNPFPCHCENRTSNTSVGPARCYNIEGWELHFRCCSCAVIFTYTVSLAGCALVRLEPYTVYIDLSFPSLFLFSFFSL